MSLSRRKSSPWALDDSELQCPKCGSSRITRTLGSWTRARGIQMFKCTTCGKKFYDRGYDDYRPTFIR